MVSRLKNTRIKRIGLGGLLGGIGLDDSFLEFISKSSLVF